MTLKPNSLPALSTTARAAFWALGREARVRCATDQAFARESIRSYCKHTQATHERWLAADLEAAQRRFADLVTYARRETPTVAGFGLDEMGRITWLDWLVDVPVLEAWYALNPSLDEMVRMRDAHETSAHCISRLKEGQCWFAADSGWGVASAQPLIPAHVQFA